jgi:threonine/homoserine/homoserine lactone efflux protein
MTAWSEHIVPAFALGAASAPPPDRCAADPVRNGEGRALRGFRVMLGANGMLFAVMVLAPFSTTEPSQTVIDVLRVVGGLFLIYLAVSELRTLRRHHLLGEEAAIQASDSGARLGPTARRDAGDRQSRRVDLLRHHGVRGGGRPVPAVGRTRPWRPPWR